MCCKIGNVTTRKYYVSSYIVLSCVTSYTITYIQCPTYINSRGVVLIKALTKLLQISALTVYNCFFFVDSILLRDYPDFMCQVTGRVSLINSALPRPILFF